MEKDKEQDRGDGLDANFKIEEFSFEIPEYNFGSYDEIGLSDPSACYFNVNFSHDKDLFDELVKKLGEALTENNSINPTYFYHLVMNSGMTFVKSDEEEKYRRIAEEYFQKKILDDEVVHHLDGNRRNNHPENLIIIKDCQHRRLHASIYSGLEEWNKQARDKNRGGK